MLTRADGPLLAAPLLVVGGMGSSALPSPLVVGDEGDSVFPSLLVVACEGQLPASRSYSTSRRQLADQAWRSRGSVPRDENSARMRGAGRRGPGDGMIYGSGCAWDRIRSRPHSIPMADATNINAKIQCHPPLHPAGPSRMLTPDWGNYPGSDFLPH